MKNRILKSNEGFSLVEMLVAVLVSGIMMLAVALFIQTTNVTYKDVSISSKLQEEASSAMTFLNEVMLESTEMAHSDPGEDPNGIQYWVFRSMNDADNASKTDSSGKVNYDIYVFTLTQETGKDGYTLRYMKVAEADEAEFEKKADANGKIKISGGISDAMYQKYIKNSSGTGDDPYSSKYNVIADSIDTMEIKKINSNNMYSVNVKYKYLNTEYNTNFSVNSRNQVNGKWISDAASSTVTPVP